MNNKNLAAKRLVDALQSDLDFAVWIDQHPNEDVAMERLLKDVEQGVALPRDPIAYNPSRNR